MIQTPRLKSMSDQRAESTSPIREPVRSWNRVDRHHDWIGQRDEAFRALYPVGSKEAKAGRADDAIFRLFGNGYATGRDVYVYNFSCGDCAANARRMVDDYLGAL